MTAQLKKLMGIVPHPPPADAEAQWKKKGRLAAHRIFDHLHGSLRRDPQARQLYRQALGFELLALCRARDKGEIDADGVYHYELAKLHRLRELLEQAAAKAA